MPVTYRSYNPEQRVLLPVADVGFIAWESFGIFRSRHAFQAGFLGYS